MGLDNGRRIPKLVEAFPGVFPSKAQLGEEFIGQGRAFVSVYPDRQGGAGGVVISRFADRAERPVNFKGAEPSMRDLSSLRTGRERRGYRWRGHLILPNARRAHPLIRGWASGIERIGDSRQSRRLPFWVKCRVSPFEPLSVSDVIVLIGNFYHGYRMPPLYCLGASSFLPFIGSTGVRGMVEAGASGFWLSAVQNVEGSINGRRVDYSAITPPA